VAVALGCLCFVAVSALGHHTWGSIDSIQRLAVTRSLLTTGSVITPEFGPVKYGPLQPVLMLPSYALGYGAAAVIGLDDPHRAGYRVTAFLFTPALVSVLVGFWYGFARRWGHRPAAAAIGAWTLLWCTLVLPYSRLLFSDVLSATMIFAGVACLLVPPGETPRRKGFLFLGAAALNYIVFLPILMFSAAAVPIREWRGGRTGSAKRSAIAGTSTLLATVGCWIAYDIARYGSPTRPGYAGEGFTTPVLHGLYGLIASPGRGLIWYSLPTAMAVILCARNAVRARTASDSRDALVFAGFLAYLVLYAKWCSFEGGWCWGPRFLLPFVPLLHLSLLPLLARARAMFVAGGLAGFLVNAWEYSTEWQAWEKATFGDGAIDYSRSVFDVRYVPALHGFAGTTSAGRFLQFLGVAALTSCALVAVLRLREREDQEGA
jgi:hypothetical protein